MVTTRIQEPLQRSWLWLLIKVRAPQTLPEALIYSLYAYVSAFITKWAIAWVLLALLAADLLPGQSAVQTTAEVLPALMVSVFVFILGAFFVVNQQATQIHSNRATLLLLYDTRVHQAVARPLVISIATLLLVLLIPVRVGTELAALAAVLVLATGFTLVGAATLLPYLMTRVSAPRNFAMYATEGTGELLEIGGTGLVVYRVGLLGEMLRRGVRNGDSLQIREALQGCERFHDSYLEATSINPEARVHWSDDGKSSIVGWLGQELVPFLVSAGQEGIGLDTANEDVNNISKTLAGFAIKSALAGHCEEYERAVDGLVELGTCTQQLRAGVINVYSEPAWGLAKQIGPALKNLDDAAAGRALARWALVIAYDVQHLGTPGHVFWQRSLQEWPAETPWHSAHEEIDSQAFQNLWANKLAAIRPIFTPDSDESDPKALLPAGVDALHACLNQAETEHREVAT